MAGLEVGHGEKTDHQSDNDTERDFHIRELSRFVWLLRRKTSS
jgi:hypothetical protein